MSAGATKAGKVPIGVLQCWFKPPHDQRSHHALLTHTTAGLWVHIIFYTVNDHLLHIQSTAAQKVTLTRVQLGLNGNFHHYFPLSAPKQVHAQHSLVRPVSWPVPDHVLKAVANERLQKLARPKTRQALFEGYDPYRVSPAARAATASPRLLELSLPLPHKCKGQ